MCVYLLISAKLESGRARQQQLKAKSTACMGLQNTVSVKASFISTTVCASLRTRLKQQGKLKGKTKRTELVPFKP